MNSDVEVVYINKRWIVRFEGDVRLGTYRLKTVAEAVGRAVARDHGSELTIKGRNGRIQRRDSHGNDPRDIPG